MDRKWNAKWIMYPGFAGLEPINVFHKESCKAQLPEHRQDLRNLHMLVRKKLNLKEEADDACIFISADDYYKLYVNGTFIGQGPAPSYYFHYNYNRYDISQYLKEGENIIAAHIYYQGLVNRVWNSGDYRQGMIAEVEVNGSTAAGTDASWKYDVCKAYTGNEIIGYDTQYLEHIDNRLLEHGWREAGFDDSGWDCASEKPEDDHKLVMQITPAVEVYEIKPLKIEEVETGHYLIDFGHEITGQFKMKAKGSPGQVIEIRCAEELEEGREKKIRYRMRCNCIYREFWTLSGIGVEAPEFYDYKAFRYVEVIDRDFSAQIHSFSAIVRHYPFDGESCGFLSSNSLLKRIWDICKQGVRYGSQEGFLDCPSREKGQYLGDSTVASHAHIYLTNDLLLFKKEIQDFALSARICPGLTAVAPGSHMQEIADYSLQWPMQLLLYYRHSGDFKFLEEMYPVAERLLSYFKRFDRKDGLLENVNEKSNIVDWPSNLRDEYDFILDNPIGEGCHNVINAFYYGAMKTVNTIRDILHIQYRDETEHLKESYINTFYRRDKNLFADSGKSEHTSLHSNILPLLFGIAPQEAHKRIIELIRRKRLNCGVYMAYFLLKALAASGEYDLLYELLSSDVLHSWGNMVKEDATTCFEVWGKNQKSNTSLCHAWASAPIPIIIEDIAGLTPALPGWEEINFAPHIPPSLESFVLEVNVKTGKIKVEYEKGKVHIDAPVKVITKGLLL